MNLAHGVGCEKRMGKVFTKVRDSIIGYKALKIYRQFEM